MIYEVIEANQAEFLAACDFERVFGSKNRAALLAYGTACPTATFFVGYAPDGAPSASCYLAGGVMIVSSDNRIAPTELAKLVQARGIAEVDSNFAQCDALRGLLGGTLESSYYMAYDGGRCEADFTGISACTDLKAVFEVLRQSHEYYRTHLQFAGWSADISHKLALGLLELVQLEVDGVPVGTGSIVSEDEKIGAIAAVAVIPAYRGRGLGSRISKYLVNRILEKGKQPLLISGYDAVAELYRKIGFHETGRWGELYLTTEEYSSLTFR